MRQPEPGPKCRLAFAKNCCRSFRTNPTYGLIHIGIYRHSGDTGWTRFRSKGPQPEKRQFLVVIDAEIIQRTKILAIERGVTASSLVQQALNATDRAAFRVR